MGIQAFLQKAVRNASALEHQAASATSGFTYKAFISYSHAADGKLAPALQTGLHRFAKPWYRLRAMRVFRDETTLALSPELWPAIESALRQSELFLYLASPEAAKSYWVEKEIEFWLGHRPKDRMLIVLTDGEILWDHNAGDFDWSQTTAVPSNVSGAFRDEPLYLDLRWAKDEEQLSLRNLTFRSAIADIASTLLGRPKDELIGEDVRRHRQTRRVAWSAVVTLLVLTVASIVAAVAAVRNQAIAEERGAIALSRQLATQAVSLAGSDRGDLALLLSLEALRVKPTVDARNGLLAALTRDPYRRFHLHGHMGEVTSLAFSPDDRELLSLGCEGIGTLGLCKYFGVRRWDAASGEPIGEVMVHGADRWTTLTTTDDDKAVVRDGRGNEWDPLTGRALERRSVVRTSPDGKILVEASGGTLALRSAESRRKLMTILGDAREAISAVAFHPSAPLMALGGSKGGVQLWDTNALLAGSQRPQRALVAHGAAVIDLDFSPDGRHLVTASRDGSVLVWALDPAASPRQLSQGIRVASVTFSRDGRRLVVAESIGEHGGAIHVWDAEGWQPLETLAGMAPIALSRQGQVLAAAGADGSIIVRDLDRTRPLARPLEDPGDPLSVAFLDQGRRVAAGDRDRTLRIWDVKSGRLDRTPIRAEQGGFDALAVHSDGLRLIAGGRDGSIFAWDLAGGGSAPKPRLIGHHEGPVAALAFSNDGRYLASGGFDDVVRFWAVDSADPWPGPSALDAGQDIYAVEFDHADTRVAAAAEDGTVLMWQLSDNPVTGRVVGTHLLQSDGMTGLTFGPMDRFLVSSSLEQTQLWGLAAGEPRVRAPIAGSFAVLNPSGELAAIVTDREEIQLVDVAAWRTFDAILGRQKDSVYAMAFSPDERLLVSAAEGDIVLWDVDLESWRERACAIARRNLTADEWDLYLGTRSEAKHKTCPNAGEPATIPHDAERALGLAVRAHKLGESDRASSLFQQAALLAAGQDDAELANRICRFGAPRGAFAEVMVACERAVALAADNPSYRDGRGIARALAGDTPGAIEDFRAYLAAVAKNGPSADRSARRLAWIQSLASGGNPFDAMELYRIRSEGSFGRRN